MALSALALLLPGLGAVPFDDPGEGQHAEIAREALVSGDWLTLRLVGVRYYDKPPLLYWLIAAGFKTWGVSEWAARLPAVLGAAAAVAATALLGARLLGPGAGALAGVALLSCALFAAFARYVRPDTLFVAAIQWGFTGLLLAVHGDGFRGRRWAIAGCAALGAAALAKDPFALVGPLGAVALALALGGRIRPVGRWLPAAGAAVLLLVGFGWYALASARNPGFLWYTVVDNHLLNAVQMRRFPDEDVPLSSLEFLAVAGLGAFPWIVPAALEMGTLVRRRAWRDPEEIPWVALGLWAAGLFGVFTLSAFKLPHYGLPAYPAVALLAARWWSEREGRSRRPALAYLAVFALMAAILGAAALSDGRAFMDTVFSVTDVSSRKEAVAAQAGPLPVWSLLRPVVARTALVFALGATALAAATASRRSGWLAAAVVAVTMLAVVPSVGQALGLVASARAVSGMAAEVRWYWQPGAVLVHEGPIENSGALELYSAFRPILVDGARSVLGMGSTFPEAADRFWDAGRLTRAWLSGTPILLVTPREPARSLVAGIPRERVRLLAARQGRWLWSNAPREPEAQLSRPRNSRPPNSRPQISR